MRTGSLRDGQIIQAAARQALYREPVDERAASFLGEAVMVEGELDGEFAETCLGRVAVRGTDGAGAARVMLRSEQIRSRVGRCPDRRGGRNRDLNRVLRA